MRDAKKENNIEKDILSFVSEKYVCNWPNPILKFFFLVDREGQYLFTSYSKPPDDMI